MEEEDTQPIQIDAKEEGKEDSEGDEDPNYDPNNLTLTTEEKKSAREEFNKIDFNRCGYVDIQELKELMKSNL